MLGFLILSMIGFLIYLFIALAVFKRGAKLTNKETIPSYLEKNLFWMIAQILAIVVISYLLTVEGSGWILEFGTDKLLSGETPFHYSLFSVLVGLCITVIIDRLRAIVKPIPIDLRGQLYKDKYGEY